MRKFFLLPIAALVAIFSFSACTDDKGEESHSRIGCEFPAPVELGYGGKVCWEYVGLSETGFKESKANCAKIGTVKNKCDDGGLVCRGSIDEDGVQSINYYYGGMIDYMEDLFGGCYDDNDDDDEPACTDPSYGEGAPLSYEGETYKTVKIGCQTWMAENLNYETEEGSECYDDDPENCEIYGRLYTWKTALSVCPSGWHLPSYGEWETLIKTVGGNNVAGKHLKATDGWDNDRWTDDNGNGLDAYGFTALPGGSGYSSGTFLGAGRSGYWWSSSEDELNDGSVLGVAMSNSGYFSDGISRLTADQDGGSSSVRCIQDTQE